MKKTLYFVPRALVVVLMLIGLLPASPAAAGSMTLQWDFNVEP